MKGFAIGYTARELASLYADELRDGIAYLAVYKIGRRYMAHAFWLTDNDTPEDEDMEELKKIFNIDKNAVVINGEYNCPFTYDSPISFMAERIGYNYRNRIDRVESFI